VETPGPDGERGRLRILHGPHHASRRTADRRGRQQARRQPAGLHGRRAARTEPAGGRAAVPCQAAAAFDPAPIPSRPRRRLLSRRLSGRRPRQPGDQGLGGACSIERCAQFCPIRCKCRANRCGAIAAIAGLRPAFAVNIEFDESRSGGLPASYSISNVSQPGALAL
jgi:hypothetical protein